VLDFSIIVPTYARATSLRRLLTAIAGLDYPTDRFEVIVVDDGGDVPLEACGEGRADRFHLAILRQPNAGPAAARNRGARAAQGRYLAFTDDDCLPDENWLRELSLALQDTPAALCGGKTANQLPASLPAQATQLLMDYLYQNYNPAVTPGAFYPTNNMAVPRKEFLDLGGFDESLRFGEDREFCYRWQVGGRPFVFAPRAVVRHAHPLGLRAFLRLHFQYGGGTGRFRRTCRAKGLSRPGYSSPLWYVGLLGYPLKRERGWRGVLLSLLIAASQAASLAGVVWAKGANAGKNETT